MKRHWVTEVFISLLLSLGPATAAFGGDSLYGRVVAVKRADLVTLDYGAGKYEVRIAGIDVPRESAPSERAREFVAKLVLDKNARMRFEGRNQAGEMVARLQTDDPDGIRDVGLELVRAGLVRRQPRYDYKYQELSKAEKEAQGAKRGIWSGTQPTR